MFACLEDYFDGINCDKEEKWKNNMRPTIRQLKLIIHIQMHVEQAKEQND